MSQTIPRAEASAVANPKKLRKPTMSVTVVNIMDDDEAGSCPKDCKIIGMSAPEKPAMAMDNIMEIPITTASPNEEAQKKTIIDVVKATATPLIAPTRISFLATINHWPMPISLNANPLIVTARACEPVFPDWPATTGRNTAKTVILEIVSSNIATTDAARNAVARFI
jgi:hypothetical protein